MSYRRTFALALPVVLLASFSPPQTMPPQAATVQHFPITADLSHGASFKFKIAPDLPEFAFKVIPEVQNPDASGNPQSTIQEVQVFRGDSKEPIQTLDDCEWDGMEPPYRDADWFRVEDMNFDAYADIFVLTTWGATGNEAGCVWLYNPKTRRFDFSKEFTEIAAFEVHPDTKTLTTQRNGGAAGTIFRAAKYLVENNRPVPVVLVAQDYDFKTKKYHCVVQQRRGRAIELETVRDVWAESKTDDFEGCDPSHPFMGLGDK